jgi:protein required for attachment to host cells
MTRTKIDQKAWVVVCDGSKALILENAGDSKFPNLQTRDVFEQKVPSTAELGTDAPGRAFASVGAGRSAIEQTDFHDQQETGFLRSVTARLDAALNAGHVKSIIVVAPPRALGVMRQSYTHILKHAVRGEIHKDFVKLPVHEIERHLSA